MDLRQLRQFVTICETLNFTRAAKALNISQPPLSVSMRKLEDELGAPLFVRHGKGIALTEEGAAALPHAREAIAAADMVRTVVGLTARGERGRVRIAFVSSAAYSLIPDLMDRFHARYPEVEVGLKETTGLEALAGLEDGRFDLALVRTPLATGPGIIASDLPREPFILLVPRGHPLASRRTVELESLRDERFVMFDREHTPAMHARLNASCLAAGFTPLIAEEAAHINTVLALVESGLGLAIVPALLARAVHDRALCIDLTLDRRPILTGFAALTRTHDQRALIRSLRDILRDIHS